MTEWIKNAWLGWQNYTENGKMIALLLIFLLLFWFGKKKAWDKYHKLFWYTTVVTVCCICPFTAVLLMLYQTKFYDYQWIWTYVPLTIVVALACTLLWCELAGKYAVQKKERWKTVGITALMLCVFYLCGSMQNDIWDGEEEAWKQKETERILEIITENGQNKDITLWAPQGIMEYARALDGSVCLPYGRNMWDPALNAYSYETYGEEESMMYEWMCHVEEKGEGEMEMVVSEENEETLIISAVDCMDMALESGVNHILLPDNLQLETLQELEEYLGMAAEKVEGYYSFRID